MNRSRQKYLRFMAFGIALTLAMPLYAHENHHPHHKQNHKNKSAWLLHGFDRTNSANSTSVSDITPHNLNRLKLKWSLPIDAIPLNTALNPLDNPRGENGTATGVAVDKQGIAYIPIFDGRLFIVDSLKTEGCGKNIK